MKRKIWLVVAALGAAACCLLLAEGAIRWLCPDLNLQGTDRALFRLHAHGASVGLVPGATGISFGQSVEIDDLGCRRHPVAATTPTDTWLVLGDSVTFGVGVAASHTFVGRLQAALPHVRIHNTAVLGYALPSYRDVLRTWLTTTRPGRVLLMMCLNDVTGSFTTLPGDENPARRLTAFLRRRSKLYMWLKHVCLDRSRAYYDHDAALYAGDLPHLAHLDEIAAMTTAAGVDLTVFLLPYEVQLRP